MYDFLSIMHGVQPYPSSINIGTFEWDLISNNHRNSLNKNFVCGYSEIKEPMEFLFSPLKTRFSRLKILIVRVVDLYRIRNRTVD